MTVTESQWELFRSGEGNLAAHLACDMNAHMTTRHSRRDILKGSLAVMGLG